MQGSGSVPEKGLYYRNMIIAQKITESELVQNAPEGDFIKFVVDVEEGVLAFGCELHIDCYKELLEAGSRHENLWGANFYPKKKVIDFISLINVRPPANRSMKIGDEKLKALIEAVVKKLIE